MDRFRGFERRLQAIFSLRRRKTVAKWCLKAYSNAKMLGKASLHTIGIGYNYVAYKVATDESARMVLAALLLVTLFSLVITVVVKRRRGKHSQKYRQQQQKEKIVRKKSDATTPVTPFKSIPKAVSSPLSRQESVGPQSRLTTLKSTLTATQTELAELKTTVTELLAPKVELQASSIVESASLKKSFKSLKSEVKELNAKVDSIEIDAGQTASQQTVIDSLSQGQTRLERSSQALLAWRAEVAAQDLANPAATQSELDKLAAELAACLSLSESVRDAQEKLTSSLQSNLNTAIKDLMQCLADGRKGAITRGVRCSMNHGGSALPETSGSI